MQYQSERETKQGNWRQHPTIVYIKKLEYNHFMVYKAFPLGFLVSLRVLTKSFSEGL